MSAYQRRSFHPSLHSSYSEMLNQRRGIENVLKNGNSGGLLIWVISLWNDYTLLCGFAPCQDDNRNQDE